MPRSARWFTRDPLTSRRVRMSRGCGRPRPSGSERTAPTTTAFPCPRSIAFASHATLWNRPAALRFRDEILLPALSGLSVVSAGFDAHGCGDVPAITVLVASFLRLPDYVLAARIRSLLRIRPAEGRCGPARHLAGRARATVPRVGFGPGCDSWAAASAAVKIVARSLAEHDSGALVSVCVRMPIHLL